MDYDIYCLLDENGNLLDPSVQASVLARYSRSAKSARETLKEVTREKADKFHDKYVVGFGHQSVLELSAIPVCFENVSIVASKFIEKWQRPGYSEKSTRYQKFSRDSFVLPPGAPESMREFTSILYEAYDKMYPRMVKRCAKLMGQNPDKPKKTAKARAFDNIRYLLPAGTGTSLAAEINFKDLRDMIVALRDHSNTEFNVIGDDLYKAVNEKFPVLIKHEGSNSFNPPVKRLFDPEFSKRVRDIPGVEILDRSSSKNESIFNRVRYWYDMSFEEFSDFMDTRPLYAEVPDVFKLIDIHFDMFMDYGAWRDLQRHRRCEQFNEPLTTTFGYSIPDDIIGSDLEDEYVSVMESVKRFCYESALPKSSLQYIIPLGYIHRSHFKMDMKELYYIVELRTKPHGHISYRRIAYTMYERAKKRWPDPMQWCRAIKPVEIGEHE
jgi:thymidylate synthase ThyX